MSGDLVHAVLGDQPVEFATAGELADLMGRLPAATPVAVSHAVRIDPDLPMDEEERVAAAGRALVLPQLVDIGGQVEQRPAPTVELGAFFTGKNRPVPASTVAVNPYDRSVEAMLDGDDDTLFAAFGDMLAHIAGCLDGRGDASLYEQLAGDANLTAQAELDAALLRHAAERLIALRTRIGAYLTNHPDQSA
jgi:hypothetical protein